MIFLNGKGVSVQMGIFVAILLIALALGGPIMAAMCGAAGIGYMFYLNFKWGPRLTLIAIPVAICFFVGMTFEDLFWMYFKHIFFYTFIVLIIAWIACHLYFEEEYTPIVAGITIGFVFITMGLLASWMYNPKDFSIPKNVASVQIEKFGASPQAVYTDSESIDALLKEFEHVEMLGSFEELNNREGNRGTYRVTFFNKKGKIINSYTFYNKYYMSKEKGKRITYYRWAEDSHFPYIEIMGMYNSAVQTDQ